MAHSVLNHAYLEQRSTQDVHEAGFVLRPSCNMQLAELMHAMRCCTARLRKLQSFGMYITARWQCQALQAFTVLRAFRDRWSCSQLTVPEADLA